MARRWPCVFHQDTRPPSTGQEPRELQLTDLKICTGSENNRKRIDSPTLAPEGSQVSTLLANTGEKLEF
jgi:hypothetical protein